MFNHESNLPSCADPPGAHRSHPRSFVKIRGNAVYSSRTARSCRYVYLIILPHHARRCGTRRRSRGQPGAGTACLRRPRRDVRSARAHSRADPGLRYRRPLYAAARHDALHRAHCRRVEAGEGGHRRPHVRGARDAHHYHLERSQHGAVGRDPAGCQAYR